MNELRIARFTSSENWKLMTDGKREMTEAELIEFRKLNPKSKAKLTKDGLGEAGLTYIKAKQYENKLQRRLNGDTFSYATSWGNFCEIFVNENHLSPSQKRVSQDFICHPTLQHFGGSPDIVSESVVFDIKCPFTLLSFCELVECLTKGIEAFKIEYPEYYWQLISNSILTDKKRIGLIAFVPYESELINVWELAQNYDNLNDPFAYKWIFDSKASKLPYLKDGGHYKNLNIFEFDVNEADQKELLERIEKYSPLITL